MVLVSPRPGFTTRHLGFIESLKLQNNPRHGLHLPGLLTCWRWKHSRRVWETESGCGLGRMVDALTSKIWQDIWCTSQYWLSWIGLFIYCEPIRTLLFTMPLSFEKSSPLYFLKAFLQVLKYQGTLPLGSYIGT